MYCREFLERVGAGQRLDGGAEAAFEELAGGQPYGTPAGKSGYSGGLLLIDAGGSLRRNM
jgi:hypothetical protein